MIENDHSNSLVIAATNHPKILDYALLRRFDDVIQYQLPSPVQAADLIRSRLGGFAPKPFPLKDLSNKVEGLSYAEIRRAVDEAIKEAVMHDNVRVKADALGKALIERRQLSQKIDNKASRDHAGTSSR